MRVRYLAVILLLWVIPASADESSFRNLYVFGDSLSDTGNLASVRGDFPAPYYQNRVSNGPVVVDVLAERLGLSARASLYLLGRQEGGNYAVAGARARGNDLIDLTSQVVMFLAQQRNEASPDALYVVFVGGNDLRDARDMTDPKAANAAVDAAVSEIVDNVELLLRAAGDENDLRQVGRVDHDELRVRGCSQEGDDDETDPDAARHTILLRTGRVRPVLSTRAVPDRS